MKFRAVKLLILVITVAAFSVPSLFAQAVELNPYFGGVWPDSSSVGELKNNALWGLRAGFHTDPDLAIEANFGYLNHFEVKGTDPKIRGILWEVGPTYSFSTEDWPVPSAFTPLVAFSVGGLTTRVKDQSPFTYNVFENSQVVGGGTQTTVRQIQVDSGDTFLTLSAGGGIKVNPGPVGVRADVRARMLPNYYRASPIWLEATVGVSFIIGKH